MREDKYYYNNDTPVHSFRPEGYHYFGNMMKDFSFWGDVDSAVNTFLSERKTEQRMFTIGHIACYQSGVLVVFNIWEKDE